MALKAGSRTASQNDVSGDFILLHKDMMISEQAIQKEESDEHCSLAETMSCGSSAGVEDDNDVRPCDACPNCDDVCDTKDCSLCSNKRCCQKRQSASPLTVECESLFPKVEHRTYTLCEVKRNIHADSCWLVAGDTIYDATPFLKSHPGGATCILRSAGGRKDCSKDISLHSKRAQLLWNKNIVGKLRPCECHQLPHTAQPRPWWLFWP